MRHELCSAFWIVGERTMLYLPYHTEIDSDQHHTESTLYRFPWPCLPSLHFKSCGNGLRNGSRIALAPRRQLNHSDAVGYLATFLSSVRALIAPWCQETFQNGNSLWFAVRYNLAILKTLLLLGRQIKKLYRLHSSQEKYHWAYFLDNFVPIPDMWNSCASFWIVWHYLQSHEIYRHSSE